jgi:sialate O-acetylesterase
MRHLWKFVSICLLTSLFAATGAHALSVDSGLTAYQVIQCDNEGKATLSLTGTATATGTLQARVIDVQKDAVSWLDLGKVAPGPWQGAIPNVPAGGPYRVEARVIDDASKTLESTLVPEILVGDVWVLAGQSNMQGVGNRVNVEAPQPQVHTFAMSYEWRLAQEPLHTLAESPDPVHATFTSDQERQNAIKSWRDGPKGAGLGIAFAKEMVARTGRPVGLIASAHGGTSMGQWDPALKDQGGASLYGSMCKQVAAAGGKVRGVLWYQGESDANPDAQSIYRDKFKALVAAMRKDFGVADLPFYYVQIGRFPVNAADAGPWNAVQMDELAVESEMAPAGLVPSSDLALNDGIHVGTQGLKTLGVRLACLAEHDLYSGKVLRGPRFDKMEKVGTEFGQQIKVKFSNVNGALKAAGRPSGFSISTGANGPEALCIYNQEISKEDPTTVILWVQNVPDDAYLWYGRGFNPYCNIVDEEGMGMPVMGPLQIPR